MATLEIRNQPRLPLRKQVQICADGILHRLFRSLITLAVVMLAVAFLMNVLTESVIATACKRGVVARLAERQSLESLTALVEAPMTPANLRQRLAELEPRSREAAVLAAWINADADGIAQLAQQAAAAQALYDWLSDLGLGYRRVLLENRDAEAALAGLAEPAFRDAFTTKLPQYPIAPPANLDATLALLPGLQDALAEAAGRFKTHGETLRQATEGRGLGVFFASHADDPAALKGLLAATDLATLETELDSLVAQAQRRAQMQRLLDLLQNPALARKWTQRFGAGTVDDALAALSGSDVDAAWLAALALEEKVAQTPSPASLQEAAADLVIERELEGLKQSLFLAYGPQPGMSASVFWLIVVSMMLCMVGITNAMLVSVLERFRDIATMKCLGALDGFIATLFMLEAAFLGIAGGAAGVIIGGIVGSARMGATYGKWLVTFFPAGGLAQAALLSILAGLTLTTLAAIYPAAKAARMPPLEAMRVE